MTRPDVFVSEAATAAVTERVVMVEFPKPIVELTDEDIANVDLRALLVYTRDYRQRKDSPLVQPS